MAPLGPVEGHRLWQCLSGRALGRSKAKRLLAVFRRDRRPTEFVMTRQLVVLDDNHHHHHHHKKPRGHCSCVCSGPRLYTVSSCLGPRCACGYSYPYYTTCYAIHNATRRRPAWCCYLCPRPWRLSTGTSSSPWRFVGGFPCLSLPCSLGAAENHADLLPCMSRQGKNQNDYCVATL